jgi:hypothetical protein
MREWILDADRHDRELLFVILLPAADRGRRLPSVKAFDEAVGTDVLREDLVIDGKAAPYVVGLQHCICGADGARERGGGNDGAPVFFTSRLDTRITVLQSKVSRERRSARNALSSLKRVWEGLRQPPKRQREE